MTAVVSIGIISTPLGPLGAAISPIGLGRLTFPGEPVEACRSWAQQWWPTAPLTDAPAGLATLSDQLLAYFEGRRYQFDLPLDLRGTPFQLQVWRALLTIPYGKTWSYGQLATAIHNPLSVRAVGAANGANPVPIVVPCHRVIGSDGTLTGYGGGLGLKRRLLELERALQPVTPDSRQPRLF